MIAAISLLIGLQQTQTLKQQIETLKLRFGNYYIPTSLSSASGAQELVPHSEASGVTFFSGRVAAIV